LVVPSVSLVQRKVRPLAPGQYLEVVVFHGVTEKIRFQREMWKEIGIEELAN